MKTYTIANIIINAVCTQDGEFLCSWADVMTKPTAHDAWVATMSRFFVHEDEEDIVDEYYDEDSYTAFIRTTNAEDESIVTDYTVTIKEEVLVLPC